MAGNDIDDEDVAAAAADDAPIRQRVQADGHEEDWPAGVAAEADKIFAEHLSASSARIRAALPTERSACARVGSRRGRDTSAPMQWAGTS